jgi:FkbM family methyltransferase
MNQVRRIFRYLFGYFLADVQTVCTDANRGGLRFAWGGIQSRISRKAEISVWLPDGRAIVVRPRDSDFETVRQVFRDEEYGRIPDQLRIGLLRVYQDILSSGKVPLIIDAGANIGAATLWFRDIFSDAAIVAIEPDPANAAIARQNLSNCEGVTLLEAAIGGETGHVSLVSPGVSYAVQTRRSDDGCPVLTIGQVVAGLENACLFMVKVDIEGFERDLFGSNTGWMDEVTAVYVEPHEWMRPGERTSSNFQREFGKRDFAIFLAGENLVYMRNPLQST